MHPFAPPTRPQATSELFRQLEDWLAEITGFAAVSLQPNAGSQGEYAGLLVIRAYHEVARRTRTATICLIPTSAHGTNPASAVMAGMQSRRRSPATRTATSTSPTSRTRPTSTRTTSPR